MFLSVADLQYQMIADKLGLEILQCGIDYYNQSEERDAAHKAMRLQKYAQSIVVGKMAKDRCNENVEILNKIIAKLPPAEVFDEDRAIKEELHKYCQLPDKICHAITLLNNTRPYLQAIKTKLGVSNKYYLELSTQVINNALYNIIEEVNAAQKDNDSLGIKSQFENPLLELLKLTTIEKALKSAWEATLIMDTFDMEANFKENRYNPNRSTLENLCNQLGVPTSNNAAPSGNTESYHDSHPKPKPKPEPKPEPEKGHFYESGCFIAFIAWLVIGCVAGCFCIANDGDFAAGFCISGVIVLFISSLFKN